MFICPFFRKYGWQRAIYLKIFLHYAPLDDPHAVLTHALTDMQYDLLDSTRERDLTRP